MPKQDKIKYLINVAYSIKMGITDGDTTVGDAFAMLSDQIASELETDQKQLHEQKTKLHDELRAVQDKINFNRKAIEELKEKFPYKESIGV